MPVHVVDFLATLSPSIGHDAKATFGVRSCAFLKRQLRRQQHHAAQQTFVLRRGMRHRRNVQLGDDQKMHGRPRVDVVKREDVVVLVHLA